MYKKIKEKIKKILSIDIVKWIVIAFCLNLFCDILNQRSLFLALGRLFTKPLNFLFNMMLIMVTVSLSGLFKKRKFATFMLCFPWLAIAIGNFVLQFFRKTPLSFVDLQLVFEVFSVFNSYLNVFHFILIGLGVVLLITGIIVLYRKDKRIERIVPDSLLSFIVVLLMVFVCRDPFIKINALSDDYSNLILAYQDYGLPYCFVVSTFDRGVHEPDDYNEQIVNDALQQLQEYVNVKDNKGSADVTINSEVKPNVIFLQLESFMDPNYLLNFEYSENPAPFYSSLREKYPHGKLKVPTFGAGTANVEFEIMTGLNLNFFGPGEYPYMTVMADQTTETIGYTLGNNGYFSTIIHNNRASFYDRDNVFANMGYDRYVSSEFMIDLEYTPVGWIKDKCLTYEIMKALNSSDGSDFIYTISVQPHGQYISDLTDVDIHVEIESSKKDYDESLINSYTYYINQIYEVDMFLKELVTELEVYKEPTILVMYGDHLPNFDISEEDYYLEDIFNSEYIIYSNFETNLENKDLTTYQLASHILENIGCNDGTINQLHQTRDMNENYLDMMQLFEYDIFSSAKHLWDGINPYERKNMQFGYDDTEITGVVYYNGIVTIQGKNFNENSVVYFNNEKQDVIFINSTTLAVELKKITKPLYVCVKQINMRNVYYTSNTYIYK